MVRSSNSAKGEEERRWWEDWSTTKVGAIFSALLVGGPLIDILINWIKMENWIKTEKWMNNEDF